MSEYRYRRLDAGSANTAALEIEYAYQTEGAIDGYLPSWGIVSGRVVGRRGRG